MGLCGLIGFAFAAADGGTAPFALGVALALISVPFAGWSSWPWTGWNPNRPATSTTGTSAGWPRPAGSRSAARCCCRCSTPPAGNWWSKAIVPGVLPGEAGHVAGPARTEPEG